MFLNIDLRSGYHLVCIKEEDIYKKTFQTRYANYEYAVVPFCLSNAPNTFMCLTNIDLYPYMDKFVIVLIDNIWIYSKNEEEHVELLAAVLQFLRENQLYADLCKCNLF